MASVFSVLNTIHTYSSSTPLVYSFQPRPLSDFALLHPWPPIHKEQKRRQLSKSPPRLEARIELVDMAGRYSFSDEGSTRNGYSAMLILDILSVDERHTTSLCP